MPPKKAAVKTLAARYASSEEDKEDEDNMATIEERPKGVKKGSRNTKKEAEKATAVVAPKKRTQKPKEFPQEIQATQDVATQSETEDVDPGEASEEEPPVPKKSRGRPPKAENAPKKNSNSSAATKKVSATAKKTPPKDSFQEESAKQSEADELIPISSKTSKKAATTKSKKSTGDNLVAEPQEDDQIIQETQDDLMAIDASDTPEPEVKQTKKPRGRPAKTLPKKTKELDGVQEVKDVTSGALRGRKREVPVVPQEEVEENIDEDMDGGIGEDEAIVEEDATTDSHRDLIKKYEQLQLSYKDLRELKETDLEKNFKEMQENVKKQNIAATKRIAALEEEVSSSSKHQKIIQALEKELVLKEKQYRTDLAAKDEEFTKSLTATEERIKNESEVKDETIKKLQADNSQIRDDLSRISRENDIILAKLDAARALASKPNGIGKSMALEKENMYGDLSGLIIRDARPNNEGDGILYDCLQTGKNGTLHFKLDVCEIPDENGGKSTETEVTYTPILDTQRDEQLISRLPSFMKEEISFPHANCAQFYTRLANTLQV